MPIPHKPMVLGSGDSMELIETSAMTGGAYVKARLVFKANGLRVAPHIHPYQDETYEVISGRLTYLLDGKKNVSLAGTSVSLPKGISHQHYSEGPEDAVTIQTMTPGWDFDYLLENVFGLGSEGRGLQGLDNKLQGLVWLRRMKSGFFLAGIPIWSQRALARIATPILEKLGYRAVHMRFSGEEW